MIRQLRISAMVMAGLLLSACASQPGLDIYVPAQDPVTNEAEKEKQVPESTPEAPSADPDPRPDQQAPPQHQRQTEPLSPAAVSLMREADAFIRDGRQRAAISRLERAQRISPRSPQVYYKLASAYRSQGQLGRAEQFALRGLSLAGGSRTLQRSGWRLLADIRRAAGDVAGAQTAEDRASSL